MKVCYAQLRGQWEATLLPQQYGGRTKRSTMAPILGMRLAHGPQVAAAWSSLSPARLSKVLQHGSGGASYQDRHEEGVATSLGTHIDCTFWCVSAEEPDAQRSHRASLALLSRIAPG